MAMPRQMTALSTLWPSFRLRYTCPEFGRARPETSPATQTDGKPSSSSDLTAPVNSLTVRTFLASGAAGNIGRDLAFLGGAMKKPRFTHGTPRRGVPWGSIQDTY